MIWLLTGALLSSAVDILLRLWRRRMDTRDEERRRNEASRTLKAHGLEPHYYVAAAGVDDPELRAALHTFARAGYIILNGSGKAVGGLCSLNDKSRPRLRLVVSNANPRNEEGQ